jgi:hypothetical protein
MVLALASLSSLLALLSGLSDWTAFLDCSSPELLGSWIRAHASNAFSALAVEQGLELYDMHVQSYIAKYTKCNQCSWCPAGSQLHIHLCENCTIACAVGSQLDTSYTANCKKFVLLTFMFSLLPLPLSLCQPPSFLKKKSALSRSFPGNLLVWQVPVIGFGIGLLIITKYLWH